MHLGRYLTLLLEWEPLPQDQSVSMLDGVCLMRYSFFIFFIYGMGAMQQTLPELTFDTVESIASVRVRVPQQLHLLICRSYSDWLLAFSQLN